MYKLPFGLKQKPLRHYFEGGSISFACKEQKLYATLAITKKKSNFQKDSDGITLTIIGFDKWKYETIEVTSKEQLNKLLAVKSFSEIPALEIVS